MNSGSQPSRYPVFEYDITRNVVTFFRYIEDEKSPMSSPLVPSVTPVTTFTPTEDTDMRDSRLYKNYMNQPLFTETPQSTFQTQTFQTQISQQSSQNQQESTVKDTKSPLRMDREKHEADSVKTRFVDIESGQQGWYLNNPYEKNLFLAPENAHFAYKSYKF